MTDKEIAIQTWDLGRQFGRRWAMRHLNFSLPRGAVCGLLGLNGAGKTTTLRMIMGLLRPTEGKAEVLGLSPVKQDVELKRRVGYVADQPNFYEWMRVDEILAFVAHYRKRDWNEASAADLTRRFHLPLDQKIRTLSKGQKAKVGLVTALAFHPELLILDEPTTGLDPPTRREFIEGVLSEFQDENRTILISSHLVDELAGLVDHVAIVHSGGLILSQPADQFVASLKRLRLTFESDPPAIDSPGIVRRVISGRDALLTVLEEDREALIEKVKAFSPSRIEEESLSLNDAFIDYISAREGNGHAQH